MVLLFLAGWQSPIRFVYFYPVYADPWLFVFLLLGLIGIFEFTKKPTRARLIYLAVISFIGVIFRESMLVIPMALLFAENPVALQSDSLPKLIRAPFLNILKMPRLVLIFPLLMGVLAFLMAKLIALPTNDSWSIIKKGSEELVKKGVLRYILGWFMCFGPILVIIFYNWRKNLLFLLDNQFLLIYMVVVALGALLTGTDTERILYWSMPVVLIFLGKFIQEKLPILVLNKAFLVVLISGQLLFQRSFWSTPQEPFLDPKPYPSFVCRIFTRSSCQVSDPSLAPKLSTSIFEFAQIFPSLFSHLKNYNNMRSYFCSPKIEIFWLLTYLSFMAVLLAWLKYAMAQDQPGTRHSSQTEMVCGNEALRE